MKFILLLASICLCGHFTSAKKWKPQSSREDKEFYMKGGQAELNRILAMKNNYGVAKNVIIFLGDGMSIPTITSSRIYKGQLRGIAGEEENLQWDLFPYVGLAKTYNTDKQVPDSAGTGTAYLCGVKTNYRTIGLDGTTTFADCTTHTKDKEVFSVLKWAQDAGKRTGVVTSTRITHATPAATYAHTVHRDWECENKIDEESYKKCPSLKDIARQLVEDEPGNKINVLLGGGYSALSSDWKTDPWYNAENKDCFRQDGRKLHKEWLDHHSDADAVFVNKASDLNKVDLSRTEYLMGLFSNQHMPYHHQIKENKYDIPTLKEMTSAAIKLLSQGDKGFFLLVESGKIDQGHHETFSKRALDETVAMDEAVKVALELLDIEETLIVVTSDHSHTMSLAGYPSRGQDITGISAFAGDDLPYATLAYANGPAFNRTYKVVNGEVGRVDLRDVNLKSWDFRRPAGVPRDSETHAGDDVAIFAIGPMSHLFKGVHEQNYIAHAMGYASCVGPNRRHCRRRTRYDYDDSEESDDSDDKVCNDSSKVSSNCVSSVFMLLLVHFLMLKR